MANCDFDWFFVAVNGFLVGMAVGCAIAFLMFACAIALKRWRDARAA